MELSASTVAVHLARAGWPALVHRLLGGVVHDLNGRITATGGVAQLLAFGDDPTEMAGALGDEVHKLTETAGALSLLVAGHEPPGGHGVALAETLPALVAVERRHRGLRDVAFDVVADPATPVTRAGAGVVVPVVLLALTRAGEEATRRDGTVRIATGRRGDDVTVTMEATGRTRPDPRPSGPAPAPDALVQVVEAGGGSLVWTAAPGGFRGRLVLPGAGA